jgi:hypothetical protein
LTLRAENFKPLRFRKFRTSERFIVSSSTGRIEEGLIKMEQPIKSIKEETKMEEQTKEETREQEKLLRLKAGTPIRKSLFSKHSPEVSAVSIYP